MTHIILATDQTETPKDQILGKDWYGDFHLLCQTYASDEVIMQVRAKGKTWNNAFDGKEIKLTRAGEIVGVELVKDYEYRLITASPGAEVHIAKKDIHG